MRVMATRRLAAATGWAGEVPICVSGNVADTPFGDTDLIEQAARRIGAVSR